MLKRPFNIFKDEAFAYSNKVLDSVLTAHRKPSKEPQVMHKAAITEEDLEKLKDYFADVLDEKSPSAVKLWSTVGSSSHVIFACGRLRFKLHLRKKMCCSTETAAEHL